MAGNVKSSIYNGKVPSSKCFCFQPAHGILLKTASLPLTIQMGLEDEDPFRLWGNLGQFSKGGSSTLRPYQLQVGIITPVTYLFSAI